MKNAKSILLLVLAILIVIVGLQNAESVETKLLFVTITMSRALLLLVTFVIGAACGFGACLWMRRDKAEEHVAAPK